MPFQVLEREVGCAFVLPDSVDRYDMRVAETGSDPRLEHESVERFLVGERLRADDFERDLPAELHVPSEVDITHPTPAEESDDAEAIDLCSGLEEHLLSACFDALSVVHDGDIGY